MYDALALELAPVPTIVIVALPLAVPRATLKVMVTDLPEVTGLAEALTVTPLGTPEAERVTDCAEPEVMVVLRVVDTLEPARAEPEVGDNAIENPFAGAGLTVKE